MERGRTSVCIVDRLDSAVSACSKCAGSASRREKERERESLRGVVSYICVLVSPRSVVSICGVSV